MKRQMKYMLSWIIVLTLLFGLMANAFPRETVEPENPLVTETS